MGVTAHKEPFLFYCRVILMELAKCSWLTRKSLALGSVPTCPKEAIRKQRTIIVKTTSTCIFEQGNCLINAIQITHYPLQLPKHSHWRLWVSKFSSSVHVADIGEKRRHTGSWWGNLKERGHLEELDVDYNRNYAQFLNHDLISSK